MASSDQEEQMDLLSPEEVGAANQSPSRVSPLTGRPAHKQAFRTKLKAAMEHWTNTDVVMWLISIDQKLFVPAVILRNLSGKTLLELTYEQLQEAVTLPANLPSPEGNSIRTLYHHIDAVRKPTELVDAEKWGMKEIDSESYGRLLSHPSGWTYDREYNEWVDYLELYGEYYISINVEVHLKSIQSGMQLLVLVTSAISSLITSVQMSKTAEDPDEIEKQSPHSVNSWIDPSTFDQVLKVALLFITFFVTLTSGYIQVRGPAWKDQLLAIAEYQSLAEQLMTLYEDNLSAPLTDREAFTSFQKQVRSLWERLNNVHLHLTPTQRDRGLREIKAKDPSTWKRVFEFQEVPTSSCSLLCQQPIELSEPVDEVYDHMLMRFSGEDMGEYTSLPEVFKQDKQEAKKALARQQKRLGATVADFEDGAE